MSINEYQQTAHSLTESIAAFVEAAKKINVQDELVTSLVDDMLRVSPMVRDNLATPRELTSYLEHDVNLLIGRVISGGARKMTDAGRYMKNQDREQLLGPWRAIFPAYVAHRDVCMEVLRNGFRQQRQDEHDQQQRQHQVDQANRKLSDSVEGIDKSIRELEKHGSQWDDRSDINMIANRARAVFDDSVFKAIQQLPKEESYLDKAEGEFEALRDGLDKELRFIDEYDQVSVRRTFNQLCDAVSGHKPVAEEVWRKYNGLVKEELEVNRKKAEQREREKIEAMNRRNQQRRLEQ